MNLRGKKQLTCKIGLITRFDMKIVMALEVVPKSDLPEWSDDDERRKKEFEDRLKKGKLHLVSAAQPDN